MKEDKSQKTVRLQPTDRALFWITITDQILLEGMNIDEDSYFRLYGHWK
jgi:hypothetical protein